jgi:hypothetical protein
MENNRQQSVFSTTHYNQSLPKEILSSIAKEPLTNTIELALSLKTKYEDYNTNEFLITVGKACQCYSLPEKNTAMENLLISMNDLNYHGKQPAAFLLTYAGAKNDAYEYGSLLLHAVHRKDTQMITALFANNTSSNQKNFLDEPIFYYCKTIPIAQMFIDKGVNLNAQGSFITPSILSACLTQNYSLKLIEFYLSHNVDATIKESDGDNLLHRLARKDPYAYNISDYIQISVLLIKAAPELLNALNDAGETPLDVAEKKLNKSHSLSTHEHAIKVALIKLFKECGGKTAEQLKQNAIKQIEPIKELKETFACCICLDNSFTVEKIMNIPCNNIHSDKICNDCYNSCVERTSQCPLCRGPL